MKALVAGFLFLLSFSTQSAILPQAECKDYKGNVVSGTIAQLKSVMANPKGNRMQVLVSGTITEIKKEDHSGRAHQKFNLKVDSDVTLLIVSNLEFGRLPLKEGKAATICGEFLRVGKGMVHWTHFDPHGPHADGFTIIDGTLFGDTEVTN